MSARERAELAWGIDVGGTDSKVGLVEAPGRVLAQAGFPTPSEPAAAAAAIADACRRLAEERGEKLERAGVGVPGPIDHERGAIVVAPNLGWRDEPFRDRLAEALGCPVVLDNDANAAAFGEYRAGAGRGARVLLLVTLGTGVGGGLVAGGEVFHGSRGRAMEIGHTIIVKGGRTCSCGKRGCLEAYFSGHALTEQAEEWRAGESGEITHEALFARHAAGDPKVTPWMSEAIDVLARGVAQAAVLFDPDRIVFTGGLTGSWDVFGATLAEGIQSSAATPGGLSAQEVVLSTLGGDAGVIGAAALAFAAG